MPPECFAAPNSSTTSLYQSVSTTAHGVHLSASSEDLLLDFYSHFGQVFYLEDVFASGQRELNAELCESLLSRLVRPMLLGDWLSGRSGAMFPQVREGENKTRSCWGFILTSFRAEEGRCTLQFPPAAAATAAVLLGRRTRVRTTVFFALENEHVWCEA